LSDAYEKIRGALARMKVFPLTGVVLLPGSAAPMHIFEPRYRELLAHAVASDGVFAIAQVMPGNESRGLQKPAVESLMCAGVVAFHELLEDGRSNLVLVGVSRVRILQELKQQHLYREFEVELVEDAEASDTSLREALFELVARLPAEVATRLIQTTSHVNGGALADIVASTITQDANRRLEILNELDSARRIEEVTDDVLMLAAGLKPKKPEGLMN
jgi:uncharacterized protein